MLCIRGANRRESDDLTRHILMRWPGSFRRPRLYTTLNTACRADTSDRSFPMAIIGENRT
jgi:hypothetical protein